MSWEQKENLDNIYVDAVNGEIPLNDNRCPNCSNGKLHIYVHIFPDEKAKGADWIKGSGWIWCDQCHCWDHFRGPLPKKWEKVIPLDISKLDLPPVHLSKHKAEIDERNANILW